MPKVTDISRQAKRPDRYSIFVDGAYSFPLTDLELSTSGLRIGQEVSEADLEGFRQLSSQSKVYEQAVRYLSYRPRSETEVRTYLKRRDHQPNQIDQAISRLQRIGLIDDRQFSQSWITSRRLTKPRSRRVLELELRQKGLDSGEIDLAMSEVSQTDEQAALRQIIAKKKAHYSDEAKLINYLVRQGFDYQTVKRTLKGEELTD